ncbi:Glycosyltransferase involved in cell wall bisynthesis [Jannaschia faecimaris]|uniref:Glycosyltransferase involved in cell wall bisynthesis n=1 Tax=Jannaschia faecimaris TaxID=1244108 RepID=A0A1H3K898_9RHOB|nr:glycosyltransferase [Jannaschia faecimaris]SDY48129.1 Glycosyltransferase involved in cell wall bisynthesis [Jannaschia faecimaris]
MKIAWVSPFAKASAIGHYSTIVCDEVAALGHEVVRVRLEPPASGVAEAGPHPHDMDFEPFLAVDPKAFDRIIYNLGNSWENHGPLMGDRIPPGVFILHDVCFPHLFFAHCAQKTLDPLALLDGLVPLGLAPENHRAISAAVESTDNPDVRISLLADLDMVGWATRNATRLFVHSPSVTDAITRKTGLPVDHLPLAFWNAAQTARLPEVRPLKHEKRTLVSFGHLVANKRVSSLIRSIGSDQALSETWQLRIVGPSDEPSRQHYMDLAEKQSHQVDLVFTGEVDDATFEAEMQAATCISCLRRPSYESGSATLALAMAINGNVLVSEDSTSSGMVQGMATMIPATGEDAAVASALREMAKRPVHSTEDLARIRTTARDMFDARNYAEALLAMLQTASAAEADVARFRSIFPEEGDFACALRRWGGPRMTSAGLRIKPILQSLEETGI